MAAIEGKKCKMIIAGKSYDIGNSGFAMRVPEMNDEEWKELVGPHDWTVTFTSKISEEDIRKLMNFYLFYPPTDLCRWRYRRQILNPGYSRYRRYLIE